MCMLCLPSVGGELCGSLSGALGLRILKKFCLPLPAGSIFAGYQIADRVLVQWGQFSMVS